VLPLKDLRGRSVGEKVTAWDGRILKKLEGYLAGEHGSRGTLLSDRAGICDRQSCGGQAEGSCRPMNAL